MRTEKDEKILFQTDQMITSLSRTNSGLVFISSFSGSLTIVSYEGQKSKIQFLEDSKSIITILISESGRSELLFMGCSDSVIYMSNLKTPNDLSELKGHNSAVLSLSYEKTRSLLFSGSSDTTVKIWNIKKGELLTTLTYNNDSILSLSIYQNNRNLFCLVGSSRMLSIIRSEDSSFPYEAFSIDDSDEVSCVTSIESIENSFVAGFLSGNIEIWSFDQYKLKEMKRHQDRVTALASMIVDNKEIIISGGRDFKIFLWEVENGQVILEISSHRHMVFSLIVNSRNNEFLSGSWDGSVRLFKLKIEYY